MKQKLKKYLLARRAELLKQEDGPSRESALQELNNVAACFEIKLK